MARYVEFSLYISAVLTSHPVILRNIYYSYKNKTGKMRPFCDAIRPLIPLFGIFVISSVWVFLSQNSIVHIEPRVLFMCFGTIFSNFTVSFEEIIIFKDGGLDDIFFHLVPIDRSSDVGHKSGRLEFTADSLRPRHLCLHLPLQGPWIRFLYQPRGAVDSVWTDSGLHYLPCSLRSDGGMNKSFKKFIG